MSCIIQGQTRHTLSTAATVVVFTETNKGHIEHVYTEKCVCEYGKYELSRRP